MNTRKTKIMKRAEEMDMEEHDTKRPRTPDADVAPSSTIEDFLEESCFIPRTPERTTNNR
jgi:glutamate formiminotransferase